MAHLGHYISGAGHFGLITFVLVGPIFTAEPLEFDVANVSVVTAEEFAALTAQPVALPTPSEPVAPQSPEVEIETPPAAPAPDATPVEEAPPAPTPVAEPEPVPEPPAPPEPVTPPQDEVATIVAPEPVETPDLPEISERPRQRPADRVAPEPVAPPEPDVAIAEEAQEAVTPEPSETPAEAEEPREATAEEAASTEIVTEANEGSPSAPTRSVRPQARPGRAAPQAAEAAPDTAAREDAVNAALQEALAGTPEPATPTGPPMTAGEREGLVVAVQECWVVDVGSQAADVIVTVAMDMNRDGTVAGGVRLVSAEGGDGRAQDVAFQAARRAVLRCQKGGYALPEEKYEQWKQIEITFNPESMRVR
ncbi:cell envelope biogenesis protein TolA [Roseobacteraceae bacterium S113]